MDSVEDLEAQVAALQQKVQAARKEKARLAAEAEEKRLEEERLREEEKRRRRRRLGRGLQLLQLQRHLRPGRRMAAVPISPAWTESGPASTQLCQLRSG
ncbi:hypothetical protein P692DRAFT_20882487 [Suillus brevipes Sb2]|nr:hypothetical protein P692DRAFT_20882487 [Suillus brevipes Sb2]